MSALARPIASFDGSVSGAIERTLDFWDWWEGEDVDLTKPAEYEDTRAARKTADTYLPDDLKDSQITGIIAEGTRLSAGERGEAVLNAVLFDLTFNANDSAQSGSGVNRYELVSNLAGQNAGSLDSDALAIHEQNLDHIIDLAHLMLAIPDETLITADWQS